MKSNLRLMVLQKLRDNKIFRKLVSLWRSNMNYRGGVIIIGSLLWDNDVRQEWRRISLESLERKIPVSVRIRYGRESGEQRHYTYTMIFSNHPTTGLGKGYIVELKQNMKNKETLKEQAIALARAEGIWTEQRPYLAKNWGAVGLLANENTTIAEWIKSNWTQIFRENRCEEGAYQFNHTLYSIDNEVPVISENGFLQIDWPLEIDNFDFLIATPTVPRPRKALTAKIIAKKMIERNYKIYFDNNRSSNITTFQDDEISKFLNDEK